MAVPASPPRNSRRPAAAGGGGARAGSRGGDPRWAGEQAAQPVRRISWPRRIGFILALCALGGTVAYASGLTGHGRPAPSASGAPTAPATAGGDALVASPGPGVPAAAPVVGAPAAAVTATATWSAQVAIPDLGIATSNLRLAIYRNGRKVMTVRVPAGTSMVVRNIPLRSGRNTITAAFVGPDGEGPRSAPVAITLDNTRPTLSIRQPAPDAKVNGPTVAVQGTTEAGATVTLSIAATGWSTQVTAGSDGRFQADVDLASGRNQLAITSADAAGNTVTRSLTVVRTPGGAAAQLTLTPNTFRLRNLPQTLDIKVAIVDERGKPVNGVPVTFSISPPGQPTSTYQATCTAGIATWSGVTVQRDGAVAGAGFVTVRATLADGTIVRASAPFTIK